MYFWDKYTSQANYTTQTTYTENAWSAWSSYYYKKESEPWYGYSSYGFSSSSGYYMVGSQNTYYVTANYYTGSSTSITNYEIGDPNGDSTSYRYRTKTANKTTQEVFSHYSAGSYIETLTASKDAYTTNARNADGFYYIRRLPVPPSLAYPNGGESITGTQTIAWTGDASFTYQIQLSTDNGAAWKTILANSSLGATTYAHNFSVENQTSLAKIRIRAADGSVYSVWDESDGVFTIQHNLPPLAANNLLPNGTAIDRTKVNRFTWVHNDPNTNDTQSSALLEWKPQNATTWNVINVSGSGQYYDMSANVFPAGEIVWRVKTFDQAGLESPYSNNAIFTAADPSNAPTITSPSPLVPIARPTVQWSSGSQTAYQIVIDDVLGVTVWDSGIVNSANKAQTIGVDLVNGGQYVLKVRIKNGAGLWTDNAILQMTVSYTPPARPIIELNAGSGVITLNITNPLPIGTEPNVVNNEVYKRFNSEWVRIATNVSYQYRDYAVASGKTYEYKIVATADNETTSESDILTESITFTGVWLHTVSDPEGTVYQFKYDGGGRSSAWSVESATLVFAGRKYPVAETGDAESYIVNATLDLFGDDDMAAMERIVFDRGIVCYRDGRGRLSFGVITRLPVVDEVRRQTVDLEIMRIDYEESV